MIESMMGVLNNICTRLRGLSTSAGSQSPWLILAVVCSAMFLDLSNLSAITIALPTIQEDFGAKQADLQWTISAYALTFGSFLLVGGRGGDIFGHKRVLLFGCSIFALFSLICAVAPTFIGLVIGRAFQGIGAAFTIPSAQAHIALTFKDPKRKAAALGYWGASGSLGFIVGLILGGVLTNFLGWRWIYWMSFIASGLLIPVAYLTLPAPRMVRETNEVQSAVNGDIPVETPKKFWILIRERMLRFDALGIALSIPGLLLFTYAITSANSEGWGAAPIVSTLVISIVMLAVFLFHERRAEQALLPPRLFKSMSFNLTLVLAVSTYAVRQAVTYFLTIQLQSYGNSPIHTSVLFIPLGVSALIGFGLSGRLVPVLGARMMFILGWALCIPGVILFSFITQDTSYWRFTFPGMILYIAGIGAVYITANFVVVSSAKRSDQGIAAGVFNVALQVGGSVLGLAVLTAVAQGIDDKYDSSASASLSEIGYQSVYYSCVVLCGISLAISLLAIKVPEAMKGSVWTKRLNATPEPAAPSHSHEHAESTEFVAREPLAQSETTPSVPSLGVSVTAPQPAAFPTNGHVRASTPLTLE